MTRHARRAAEAVLPRSVALAFHGEYVRARPKCSYFFGAYANIRSKVVADLRAHGVRVHSFFHSMASEPELDARLVCALKPASHTFARARPTKIVDSYIAVLDLVARARVDVDAVVLMRFDVVYRKRISQLPINWTKVTYAWPDAQQHTFGNLPNRFVREIKTSDLLMVMPLRYVGPMRAALLSIREANPQRTAHLKGNAHWTYDPLGVAIGYRNLAFVDPRPSTSAVSWSHGRFLAIDRSCPPADGAPPVPAGAVRRRRGAENGSTVVGRCGNSGGRAPAVHYV